MLRTRGDVYRIGVAPASAWRGGRNGGGRRVGVDPLAGRGSPPGRRVASGDAGGAGEDDEEDDDSPAAVSRAFFKVAGRGRSAPPAAADTTAPCRPTQSHGVDRSSERRNTKEAV